MSRGHGRIQLQVLEFLLRFEDEAQARGEPEAYVPVIAIAGQSPSRSRIESIRRAVKSLADEGLIELHTDDSSRPGSTGRQLSAVGASSGLMARLVPHRDPGGGQAAAVEPPLSA
ncbi:MAG TPA: hypothetical protein VME70_15815 [Mycobacteriales bacterium]|nr:hypothetical protein [Mycobacteriales bacterium]